MPKQKVELEVMPEKCKTCPFAVGSPYVYLADDLAKSALTEKSRICHSTGARNAINYRTGKKPMICRGARDIQIRFFHSLGVLSAPTDAAWAAKWAELKRQR